MDLVSDDPPQVAVSWRIGTQAMLRRTAFALSMIAPLALWVGAVAPGHGFLQLGKQPALPGGFGASVNGNIRGAKLDYYPNSGRALRVAGETMHPAATGAPIGVILAAVALAGAAARAASRKRSGLVARRANIVATHPGQAIPWWHRLVDLGIEPGIGIWAEKLNMTHFFVEDKGNYKMAPGTILVIKRGGNYVTGKRWPERHGKYACQVAYDRYQPTEEERRGKYNGWLAYLNSINLPPMKKVREFNMRPQEWEKFEVGQKLWPSDLFKEGDKIDIHGRSKTKGFCGAIKRHGHHRGPMTHGSKHHRRYGAVGAGTKPGRVLPFKKMPGQHGGKGICEKNAGIMKIIDHIDEDNMPETIIVVSGVIPGYAAHTDKGGSYVYLHQAKKERMQDGRFKRDYAWYWYSRKGDDRMTPLKNYVWCHKTIWGQDIRWIQQKVKEYWPDGFPGYDHTYDPFHDDCDPKLAMKAPEW